MRLLQTCLFERTHLRRAISIATAVLYSFLVFGVPLPAAARKRGDTPFPCQDNPCGCATAEQCWRSCCCTTPAQRFAWAARQGVIPPDYAVRPDTTSETEGGWRNAPEREQDAPNRQCCAVKKPCCEKPDSEFHDQQDQDDDSPRVTFVLGIAAQKCQGQTAMGAAAGLAAVPTAWISWQPHFEPLGWVEAPAFVAKPDMFLPPLPPPRLLAD